ncbi:enoyl-CoA hydratase/isomerase family protein [Daeguia caeni]|uniref:Enoyl-CoA hydratase/isomerase family protein n=1 Tax=Daeguia caeni TaxID=439612 RepID=A0ABV9H867_9HYPH
MSILLIEDRGHVRLMTLNRPESINSINMALYARLIEALEEADADENVRAIVLTGAGRGFCSGADTREFENLTPENEGLVAERAELTYRLHYTIPRLKKTVVAAVHGYAVGGGAGLAQACDIVVAGEDTRIGYPEIRHGLVAAVVMANLVKQIGQKAAYSLVAEGRVVDAQEAWRLGMVTHVVPEGEHLAKALEIAEKLAIRVPSALQATKQLFKRVCDVPLAEGQDLGRQANEAMRAYRAEAMKAYAGSVINAKTEVTA